MYFSFSFSGAVSAMCNFRGFVKIPNNGLMRDEFFVEV